MMAMHRKNKAPRGSLSPQAELEWFQKNRKRQRMRRDMAAASRKRNRK